MNNQKPKLVVLGSGFSAFSIIKKVNTDLYDLTVVSPRNHFLFTPLLPSTTVGTIEFRSIIEPIRASKDKMEYYLAKCSQINTQTRHILCQSAFDSTEFNIPYDLLVIAVGARINTYNISGVNENCLFLKEIADARLIRSRIIECFESAQTPGLSDEEIKQKLHFVVVGGGPTGIEFAAEMHDFLEEDLEKFYPKLSAHFLITVLEAAPKILGSFDAKLGEFALKAFQRQKIEVKTHSPVNGFNKNEVILKDGTIIPCGLIVWSGGNGPRRFVESLPFEKDKGGRLLTDSYFRLPGFSNIYALGDCANVDQKNYAPTAQVAQQQGAYLGKMFNQMALKKEIYPFQYKHLGMMAYIGSHQALADLPNVKGRGFATWLFWRSAYLTKLVSFKNKVLVLFDWFKKLLFGRDISRF